MHQIDDLGGGRYMLTVNNSPAVMIDWLHGQRACHWMVRGPLPLAVSLDLMEGFMHLIILLGDKQQACDQPPAIPEELVLLKGANNGQHQKRSRSSRVA